MSQEAVIRKIELDFHNFLVVNNVDLDQDTILQLL